MKRLPNSQLQVVLIFVGAVFLSLYTMIPSMVLLPEPVEETAPKTSSLSSSVKEHETVEVIAADSRTEMEIDWSDSIFKRQGWDNDPIVIESHKLLFFTVPKNACTTFKKLFRRMMGHGNWLPASGHDPEKNGLKYLGHYSREQQEEFMTSPEWTRAIFVRDPLERTLSAYMDKAMHITHTYWKPHTTGAYIKRLCCTLLPETPESKLKMLPKACRSAPLWPYKTNMTKENFPFETFVTRFMRQCPDPHWSPQYKRMRPANWKHINFVGHFETKKEDTHKLLKRIGAFDEFGASGWGQDDNNEWTLSIFETNVALHKTGSGKHMNEHYTEIVRDKVMKYYGRDYRSELFNFSDPFLVKNE
mmetsp:Transcript_31614/g.74396  ORF Transcript_31614/g.74396 Transcript_31614/m.74396 type:complete len:360 (+) Transcript_31614:114-1193(+)